MYLIAGCCSKDYILITIGVNWYNGSLQVHDTLNKRNFEDENEKKKWQDGLIKSFKVLVRLLLDQSLWKWFAGHFSMAKNSRAFPCYSRVEFKLVIFYFFQRRNYVLKQILKKKWIHNAGTIFRTKTISFSFLKCNKLWHYIFLSTTSITLTSI